jgi:D-alanine--poly(phosphoribitol) ligase subunit 1
LVENLKDLPAADSKVIAGLNRWVTASTPAYIMFTSGSTGFPKGAVMTHQNLMNFIDWARVEFGISENDVLTNVNPLYFDNSVFDVYASLFNGAALVPYDKSIIMDTGRFVASIESCGCTLWFSVPSMLIYLQKLRVFTPMRFKNFRKVIFGGEGYPKAKLKILFDLYNHRLDLVNVYGPTECTCICSAHTIVAEDFEDMQGYPRLGYLIPNFDYLILDEELKPVLIGQPGELCLRGPNVGLGYYNDTERTAEAFIQNPLNQAYRDVIYRTGDLVSLGVDQQLYIHGRADNQVKHMGYRIELEEIETALSRLKYVNQAVVVHKRNNNSRLIAVVESSVGDNGTKITDDLRKHLPDYMVPNEVRLVSSIPKNQNGKVDRAFLKQKYASEE